MRTLPRHRQAGADHVAPDLGHRQRVVDRLAHPPRQKHPRQTGAVRRRKQAPPADHLDCHRHKVEQYHPAQVPARFGKRLLQLAHAGPRHKPRHQSQADECQNELPQRSFLHRQRRLPLESPHIPVLRMREDSGKILPPKSGLFCRLPKPLARLPKETAPLTSRGGKWHKTMLNGFPFFKPKDLKSRAVPQIGGRHRLELRHEHALARSLPPLWFRRQPSIALSFPPTHPGVSFGHHGITILPRFSPPALAPFPLIKRLEKSVPALRRKQTSASSIIRSGS